MRLALEQITLLGLSTADTIEGTKGLLIDVRIPIVFSPADGKKLGEALAAPPIDGRAPDYPPQEDL